MPVVGVQVAPDDGPLVVNPTWVDIGTLAGVSVEAWSIDRGRLTERDQTGTGTAHVELYDRLSVLDPTNTSGTMYGRLDVMRQASIVLYNPVSGGQGTVFRGYLEDWTVHVDVSERFSRVTLDFVDAFEPLGAFYLRPGTAGDAYTSNGDVIYLAAANPQVRIQAVLADVGWPSALSEIYTGNVSLQAGTYASNTPALSVIHDAADAEGLGNAFVNRQGTVAFHGRMSRFRPDVAEYHISQWKVGDMAAFGADSNIVPISGLSFNRSKDSIINSALVTPQNIAGTSVAGNLHEDASSIGTYFFRSYSAESLLTSGGISSNVGDAVAETSTIGTYYMQNFRRPTTRVGQVTFTSPAPTAPTASRLWTFLTQVDISDSLAFTTTHPGGGGFSGSTYFVEGLHYQAVALGTSYHHVEFSADVSSAANFGTFTFGTFAPL